MTRDGHASKFLTTYLHPTTMAYLGSTTGRDAGATDSDTEQGARSPVAGRGTRNGGARRAGATADAHTATTAGRSPRVSGRSYDEERNWARVATFGGGIAVGALLGAGIALLFAPAAGEETRELLLEHARAAGGRVRERFDDLRDDVRFASRRGRRGMRRGLARSRWALEDAYDRGSRRLR